VSQSKPSSNARRTCDAGSTNTGDADTDEADFDDVTYNNLKRLAADAGVTPGPQPTRDDLVETLVDAGVDPE